MSACFRPEWKPAPNRSNDLPATVGHSHSLPQRSWAIRTRRSQAETPSIPQTGPDWRRCDRMVSIT